MTRRIVHGSRRSWSQTHSDTFLSGPAAASRASRPWAAHQQHLSTNSEGRDIGYHRRPDDDVIRYQPGEGNGDFRDESHMNPEAAPFEPGYQESQQQNASSSGPFSPVQSLAFHSQLFPPRLLSPFTPHSTTFPPFHPQPYVPTVGAQISPCVPAFSSTVPLPAPIPCYGPCCYAPMAPPTGNHPNSQHWVYSPPSEQLPGSAAMSRSVPVPAPVQGSTGRQVMNTFYANPVSANSARGLHSPMISPSRNQPVFQNYAAPNGSGRVNAQSNVFQGTGASNLPEYKGPLIVPPAPKQPLAVTGANTHSPVSHTDSQQIVSRENQQPLPQGGISLITRQMAATTLSNNNPEGLTEVKDITVTNTKIAVQGSSLDIPIDDGARYSIPPKGGVLKLMNIPYSATKQEVVHLMGSRAKLIPMQRGTSVHIIMDRSTAKTMDCYVEFVTAADAKETLEWLNRGLPAVPPRLGDRHIDIEMSSQDELLKDLFPRAKCIKWSNGRPILVPNTDPYSVGFQSFLTAEEIFCMVRNAEQPRRAPFANKCPQRTYEALISTLYKFPWHATTLYTVEDRNALYHACYKQLEILAPRVAESNTLGLDSRLVLDLLNAGLNCPTFNERQKAALHSAANDASAYNSLFETAKYWPFDVLVGKPNATREAVDGFARLVSAGVEQKAPGNDKLANKWLPRAGVTSPFGPVWLEFAAGHTSIKWNIAIQFEIGVLRGMVEEGLKAMREAPPRRTPRMPLGATRRQTGASQFGNRAPARRR